MKRKESKNIDSLLDDADHLAGHNERRLRRLETDATVLRSAYRLAADMIVARITRLSLDIEVFDRSTGQD